MTGATGRCQLAAPAGFHSKTRPWCAPSSARVCSQTSSRVAGSATIVGGGATRSSWPSRADQDGNRSPRAWLATRPPVHSSSASESRIPVVRIGTCHRPPRRQYQIVAATAPRRHSVLRTSSGRPVSDTGPPVQSVSAQRWRPLYRSGSVGEAREPEGDLPLGTVRRVRGVHQVLPVGQGEVAADRTGGGLAPVGGADQCAYHLDRLIPGQDRGDQRTAGHELLQRRVERLADVVGVVLVGERGVHGPPLQRVDRQPLALEPADDLSGQTAAYRIGLDQYERALGHGGSLLDSLPEA